MCVTNTGWLIKNQAEKLAKEFGFTSLPICPKVIAEKSDIPLQALPPSIISCSGRFIRVGDNFGIMYATYVPSEGFQRFSIAHELGHYFLEGHPEAVIVEGKHESNAGFASTSKYEREADTFAAALLMPEDLFKSAMDGRDLSLEALTEVAELCITSLTSTAFRWVELSKRPCGLVMSDGRTIITAYFSETMKTLLSLAYLKGQSVPFGSITHTFLKDPVKITSTDRLAGQSNAIDWFGKGQQVTLREEVIGLGAYGRTLTLLIPDVKFDDDYDDDNEDQFEERLVESWTPKFRKR